MYRTKLDTRLLINTLLLVLIFFLLLNTYLTVELKKKLPEQKPIQIKDIIRLPQQEPVSVSVYYLVDGACATCYNVTFHRNILHQLGFDIGEEQFIDISDDTGQQFIDDYNITLVPTFILSEDAEDNALFNRVWGDVGTKEQDGNYVFRKVDALANITYYNLATDEIVTPQ